jgi:hypothetical protein
MAAQKDLTKTNLTKLEEYIDEYYPKVNGSDLTTLIDIIFMATVRNDITVPVLLKDLYKGILNRVSFYASNSGDIYDFINPKYRLFAKRIKDIIVGSNGGMANVGKGEWLISLCSGINPETGKPYVNIIKNGLGDIQYLDKNEEVKWNGGKVSVENAGTQVNKKFKTLIDIPDKTWVPFRVKDKKKYSEDEEERYNAIYWQAISGEENGGLTDNELKQKIINMSFIKVFEKSDSFIMFNDDGKFQRFCNVEDTTTYYSEKLDLLKGTKCGFECRASQTNPIALYCYVF